jgi:hypothetical protein
MSTEPVYEYKAFYASNSSETINELLELWADAGWTLHSATPIPGSVLMIWQRRSAFRGQTTPSAPAD